MNQIKYILMVSLFFSATAVAQELNENPNVSNKPSDHQGERAPEKPATSNKLEKSEAKSAKQTSDTQEIKAQQALERGEAHSENQRGEKSESDSRDSSSSSAWWKYMLLLGLIALGYKKFGSTHQASSVHKESSDSAETQPSVDHRAEWFSRFEKAQSDHISAYIAYYLVAMAKEADWDFEHIDILYERYGRQLSIPSIDPKEIVGSRSSTEAHRYLMEWLESKGATISPRLGMFDNLHPWMKQVAQNEAKILLEKLKEELGV